MRRTLLILALLLVNVAIAAALTLVPSYTADFSVPGDLCLPGETTRSIAPLTVGSDVYLLATCVELIGEHEQVTVRGRRHVVVGATLAPVPPVCPGGAPMPGWACVNGGWVPPDHPLARQ